MWSDLIQGSLTIVCGAAMLLAANYALSGERRHALICGVISGAHDRATYCSLRRDASAATSLGVDEASLPP